jgi:hypothetical protein
MITPKITTLLGIAAVTAGTFAVTAPAFGVTIATLNGSLANEDAIASVTFTAPGTPLNFKTTSYSTGNFSPVLTLFNASDDYDSEYIASGDLDLNLPSLTFPGLIPGNSYRAVISAIGRYFNSPTNTNFSAGFSDSGFFGVDDNGAPLGSNYALTISTVTTSVPEPSGLIGTAIAGFATVLVRRKLSSVRAASALPNRQKHRR